VVEAVSVDPIVPAKAGTSPLKLDASTDRMPRYDDRPSLRSRSSEEVSLPLAFLAPSAPSSRVFPPRKPARRPASKRPSRVAAYERPWSSREKRASRANGGTVRLTLDLIRTGSGPSCKEHSVLTRPLPLIGSSPEGLCNDLVQPYLSSATPRPRCNQPVLRVPSIGEHTPGACHRVDHAPQAGAESGVRSGSHNTV
jgi:hypothetical protein